ncbi:hypothetical protein [Thermococcus nautili]|uniref:Uncharacterized protein n=1 Tax=Thermococcus nautili TaxID=195522 RepID=W8PII3_9EURY|nr:hypothetical protein [Thermococcus nautili]AHL21934.1 hypothetical protein BD01_0307 [Thermococcus nautili]
MKFVNAVPILYYELNVPPERVREAFPLALEFKNPTPESFSIVQPPGKNAGLLVIDVKAENRYVFVLSVKDELVLINETLPRVFVIHPKNLGEFFRALAEDELESLKGTKRKGKWWRFLIDFAATSGVIYIENELHIGFWTAILLAVIFAEVEYLFGPKQVKGPATELDEKTVRKMYEVSEKKGKVVKVSL